jgi:hypothetical protein
MSTGVTVLIIAIVVIAILVIIALVSRSKKQQKPHMGLPDLGALSTDGLDKQHASAPHAPSRANHAPTSQPPSKSSATDTAPPERRA